MSAPSATDSKMTKTAMVSYLASQTDLSKPQVKGVIEHIGTLMTAQVAANGTFSFDGLFKVVKKRVAKKPARMGRNPATGEEMKLKPKPAHDVLKIRPLKKLKDAGTAKAPRAKAAKKEVKEKKKEEKKERPKKQAELTPFQDDDGKYYVQLGHEKAFEFDPKDPESLKEAKGRAAMNHHLPKKKRLMEEDEVKE